MRNNDILNQRLSVLNLDYNDFRIDLRKFVRLLLLYKTKPQFCKITVLRVTCYAIKLIWLMLLEICQLVNYTPAC